MQTIGDRLAEARKRLGISLREASEATRIRSDFLSAMEDNSFKIDLPEVYRRGFLKIYANYLKLESPKLLTDYDSIRISEDDRHPGRKEHHREFLGRIEVPEEKPPPAPKKKKVSPKPDTPEPVVPDETWENDTEPTWKETLFDNVRDNRDLYLKVGAGLGALVLVVLLVMLFVTAIGGNDSTPADDALANTEETDLGGLEAVEDEVVSFIATGDIASVIVTQLYNDQVLYSGSMAEGDAFDVTKRGRIRVQFSAGENLEVVIDGQRYRLGREGVGRRTIP